jgi:hypothetical protein
MPASYSSPLTAVGSNSARSNVWKLELQRFSDNTGLIVHVYHFPPDTSKWNKTERRLSCHITENWRGRPLIDHETVVQFIGGVRTTERALTFRASVALGPATQQHLHEVGQAESECGRNRHHQW